MSLLSHLRHLRHLPYLFSKRRKSVPNPSQILGASLAAWYKPEAFAGLPDATDISSWADASGNGRDLALVGANPCVLLHNQLDSKPAVRFAKSLSNAMRIAFTLNQPWTTWFVAKSRTVAAAGNETLFDGAAGGNTARVFAGIVGTNELSLFAGAGVNTGKVPATNAFFVFRMLWNNASSSFKYNNDAPVGAAPGASNAGGLTIASFGTGASAFQDVDVVEWIGATGDQTALEPSVRSYLKAKYPSLGLT